MQLFRVRVYPYRLSGTEERNDYRPVPAKLQQHEKIYNKLGFTDIHPYST
jgi:hypothetical protein